MGVKFRPFAIVGGAGSDGSFVDTFQRANTGEGAPPNWTVNRGQSTVNVALFNINTNSFRFINTAGTSSQSYAIPLPGQAVFGSGSAGANPLQAGNHFSELTWLSDNSTAGVLTRVGPCVSLQGLTTTTNSAYWIENLPELLSFNVGRWVNSATTNLVDHSATPLYSTVVGLKLKISVEYTSATVTTVRSYMNGVLIDTFLDTNAARLTNGGPGILGSFASATKVANFSRYACGPGI